MGQFWGLKRDSSPTFEPFTSSERSGHRRRTETGRFIAFRWHNVVTLRGKIDISTMCSHVSTLGYLEGCEPWK